MDAYISSYMPVHTYLSRLESFEHLRREPQSPQKIKQYYKTYRTEVLNNGWGFDSPLGRDIFCL